MTLSRNIWRHQPGSAANGSPAISAARMPMQMESWLRDPRAPRTEGGDTSEMYTGTTHDDSPMPSPAT
eukprot:2237737-Pyramimonas_sp.AAC.1